MKGGSATSAAAKDAESNNSSVGLGGLGSLLDMGLNGTTKKVKKALYEKHLEEINKELLAKSDNSVNGKCTKKQKMKPEQEMILIEQKCALLLKLKRHKEVIDDGYSNVGRLGPNVVIYKCILIALVRLGKSEDDIVELLEAWKKATPKCLQMQDTQRKFDGYLTALRSGMKHCDIFSGIEDALSLNVNAVLSKQITDNNNTNVEDKKWRFRAPPPRHTTFSLCPRALSADSCIYGEECLFAHSQEELKEWKMRADVDKKNNNNNNLVHEDEDGNRQSGKKRQSTSSLHRSLLIPPLCIHYLIDLGKKIKESADITEVLRDEIPGVKIRQDSPFKYQRRVDGINNVSCTWTFVVTSKMPMGTVTILHDSDREYFNVSSAIYFNKKKEGIGLIELHPNNKVQTKLQVLNTFIQPSLFLRFNTGWPETCSYKIDVTFESPDPFLEPKLYRQSIVFDFKKDPKVVKHISVEVFPKVEPIGNHLSADVNTYKSVWATPTPPPVSLSPVDNAEEFLSLCEKSSGLNIPSEKSDSIFSDSSDFPTLGQYINSKMNDFPKTVGSRLVKNSDVVDSESGQNIALNLLTGSASGSCEGDVSDENLFLENVPLSPQNYSTWMRDFLAVEQKARRKVLNEFKKVLDIKLIEENLETSQECLIKYPFTGQLYGKIDLTSDILCEPKVEMLINSAACNSIIISNSFMEINSTFRKHHRRYLCKVSEKRKSAIVIAIGQKAVDDLQLFSNETKKLHVEFVLNSCHEENVKNALDELRGHHMSLLFPNFENCRLPSMKVLDAIGMINDEELSLNNKQMSAYNLVNGRKVLADGEVSPPLLITGGVSTGKTYLLAQCFRGLLRAYPMLCLNRILVCSQSNVSADLFITEYLHPWLVNDELCFQRSKPLRVYDPDHFVDVVSGAVKHYCLFDEYGSSFRYPSRDEVLSHRVIVTTYPSCSALLQLGLDDETFSHIFIDEAANCLESDCILPIALAGRKSKIIIAGDVMGQQPMTFSSANPPLSLVERLRNMYPFRHPFVVNLMENYLNHEVIVKFISEAFYHDQLRCVSNQPCHPDYYPLTFYHVQTSKESQSDNGGGLFNLEEMHSVADFTEELMRNWPETWGCKEEKDSLIIVTPYLNQMNGLRVQLQLKGLKNLNVELASNVTDKKYRVVIISTVRSFKEDAFKPPENKVRGGFFSDPKLVRTALSCAKSLLVVFGEAYSLWEFGECRDIWKKFIAECHAHHSLEGVKTLEQRKTKDAGHNVGSPTRQALNRGQNNQAFNQHKVQPSRNIEQPVLLSGPIKTTSIPPMFPSTIDKQSNIQTGRKESDIWTLNISTLHEAPKSDLFSAFNSNTLYTGCSNLEPKEDPQNVSQLQEKSAASFNNPSEEFRSRLENKLDVNAHANFIEKPTLTKLDIPDPSLFKPLEVYSSSLEAKSRELNSSNIFGDLHLQAIERMNKSDAGHLTADKDLNLFVQQSMPLPVPTGRITIPSRVLFDPKCVIDREMVSSTPIPEARNLHSSSLSPPLLRGPPGFSPIPPIEQKIENFSNLSGGLGNGYSPKFGYRRNTFELPPRMLRNLHLNTPHQKSPIRRTINSQVPRPEMNFFHELGLDLETSNGQCRSTSSASSEHSCADLDDSSLKDDQSAPPSLQDDWIEVKKSNKKGKTQPLKRIKAKEKHAATSVDDSAEGDPEMSVNDKVEIITQMGFSRAQSIKALETCDKDLQSAVDWLISKS